MWAVVLEVRLHLLLLLLLQVVTVAALWPALGHSVRRMRTAVHAAAETSWTLVSLVGASVLSPLLVLDELNQLLFRHLLIDLIILILHTWLRGRLRLFARRIFLHYVIKIHLLSLP